MDGWMDKMLDSFKTLPPPTSQPWLKEFSKNLQHFLLKPIPRFPAWDPLPGILGDTTPEVFQGKKKTGQKNGWID